MNKQTTRSIVLLTVLSYSILTINSAHAGFFDWLVSRESNNGLLVQFVDEHKSLLAGLTFNTILTPQESNVTVVKTYTVRATGYSSTPDQTDDTPFITAKGTYVRDGIIAANFLPFGTKVRIPEVYGDKIFVVEDRMNKRYWYNIDIWFPERDLALQFGSKNVTIEVVEES